MLAAGDLKDYADGEWVAIRYKDGLIGHASTEYELLDQPNLLKYDLIDDDYVFFSLRKPRVLSKWFMEPAVKMTRPSYTPEGRDRDR